uniref:Uncharacterized protein n=1 Tax=Nelumbo nucifera TaxID=4432 RepID=A0A822Y277_NELNU|nr:TPA_asm: hypothetical protein HUJ06_027531 [Nelumbo nucifera]
MPPVGASLAVESCLQCSGKKIRLEVGNFLLMVVC